MINFYTFYSGSRGNSAFISDGDTNILIDAGVSASRIVNSLRDIGVSPEELDAVLVTHEHSDHVSGLKVLSDKFSVPVYANENTAEKLLSSGYVSERHIKTIDSGSTFSLRSAEIRSFRTPHDSIESVGYVIRMDDKKFGIATDTGCITKPMLSALANCEAVLIEANHDVEMLKTGKYPYHLKKRILSDNGHLSNENSAWLATQLALWGTKRIALGHLSENNNTPEKVYAEAEKMLSENGFNIGSDVKLVVAEKANICEI